MVTTIPAYTTSLDLDYSTDYRIAYRRGEAIFGSCHEWTKKRAKEIKGEHAHRLAEAQWFKAAAEMLRQKLEEESDPQFWIDKLNESNFR